MDGSAAAFHEGGVYTWGKNDYGQLGIAGGEPRLRPGPLASPLADVEITAATVACGYVIGRRRGDCGGSMYGVCLSD